MADTVTIRELRNAFPKVRQLIEDQGEVVVTERGRPRYRLARYAAPRKAAVPPKDYLARLRRHQPRPVTADQAAALHEANRGER